MNHPQRLAETAAFGQLDVDPIDCPCQLRNIAGDEARFVSENRQLGPIADEPQPFDVVGRHWLLQHLDLIVSEEVAHANGLFGRPRRVGVDAQALLWRCVPNDADNLCVAIGAKLDL